MPEGNSPIGDGCAQRVILWDPEQPRPSPIDTQTTMTAVPRLSALRLAGAVALVATAAACSHDSSNATGVSTTSANGFSISVDEGSNLQIVTVGNTVHVSVTLANSKGESVNNQETTWIVESGGGSIATATSSTNGAGQASNDWTLGTASGPNTLTAAVSGVSVTITATASPDSVRGIIKASLDSQTVVATASSSFIVRAVDRFNNPVPGITVNWTTSDGTLAATSTTTGLSGNAQVTLTTNQTPAVYTVTATAPGFAPVTFTLTGS